MLTVRWQGFHNERTPALSVLPDRIVLITFQTL